MLRGIETHCWPVPWTNFPPFSVFLIHHLWQLTTSRGKNNLKQSEAHSANMDQLFAADLPQQFRPTTTGFCHSWGYNGVSSLKLSMGHRLFSIMWFWWSYCGIMPLRAGYWGMTRNLAIRSAISGITLSFSWMISMQPGSKVMTP